MHYFIKLLIFNLGKITLLKYVILDEIIYIHYTDCCFDWTAVVASKMNAGLVVNVEAADTAGDMVVDMAGETAVNMAGDMAVDMTVDMAVYMDVYMDVYMADSTVGMHSKKIGACRLKLDFHSVEKHSKFHFEL